MINLRRPLPQINNLSIAWPAITCVAIVFGPAATTRAQFGPAPVIVTEVVEREVASGQTFVGTVLPRRRSTIGSAVDGRVASFPINEGDRVVKGQTLARLLSETLEIQLSGAQAELELRRQELAELENGSRPEEIEQAVARMRGAEALMEYAQAKYDRTKSLFEQRRAVSEDQLQSDLSMSVNTAQVYAEAKSAHTLAVEGPRAERIAQARARVTVQEEIVRGIEDQIRKHTLIAPFDGYVVAEHTEVGQWLSRAEPVAEVAELDEVDVEALVLEGHVPHLYVGMAVRIEVPAVPDETFEGKLVHIVPQADLRARSFPIKVRVTNIERNGSPLLMPGMFARATLAVGKPVQALMAPKDAVVLGGATPTIYIVDGGSSGAPEGKARPVSVELGVAAEGWIQVVGEVRAGERVVIEGNERLRPGQDVRIQGS